MIACPECGKAFEPIRKNQRFCCTQCKDAYHNREKTNGMILPECFRETTQEYADGLNITLKEAVAMIYASGLRWTEQGRTLTDEQIFGKPEQEEK